MSGLLKTFPFAGGNDYHGFVAATVDDHRLAGGDGMIPNAGKAVACFGVGNGGHGLRLV
jgi:hypothetical protein